LLREEGSKGIDYSIWAIIARKNILLAQFALSMYISARNHRKGENRLPLKVLYLGGEMRENLPAYRITDLAESERPRERLAKHGPQALTNAELLAILLRVGVQGENAVQVGQRLLGELGGIYGIHRAPFDEVCDQHGVGPAKAAQIKAALELGHRLARETPNVSAAIHSPDDAGALRDERFGAGGTMGYPA
jgi:hypothetical protein